MDFKPLISSGMAALALTGTEKQIELLALYASNLLEHGEERGLTAFTQPEDIARELILDALGGVTALDGAAKIADLGSGGGTPGLPLAIMLESSQFTLVESNQRKARWIAEQIESLHLQDRVTVLSSRIEELGRQPEHRQQYDIVVAKALAALPALIELSLPLLKVGGRLVAYKGSKYAQEIAEAERALRELKGKISVTSAYELEGRERVLVQIKKLQPTPKLYPRRVGIPQHKPL